MMMTPAETKASLPLAIRTITANKKEHPGNANTINKSFIQQDIHIGMNEFRLPYNSLHTHTIDTLRCDRLRQMRCVVLRYAA